MRRKTMSKSAYIRITESGEVTYINCPNLADLQRAVTAEGDTGHSLIESIQPQPGAPLDTRVQVYGNEEALMRGYRPNPKATRLLNYPYFVHGPVIVRDTRNAREAIE
jgi:hypothetical protein